MFSVHIPEAVTVIANYSGWHRFLAFFLPSRKIAEMYCRKALIPMYANRNWPDKPLLIWLPNGQLWRAYDDGTVQKFERSMLGPKVLEGG